MELYDRLRSNKVEYKLSILICTLPIRGTKLSGLLGSLRNQILSKSVQILYLGDDRSMKVGEKRNALMSLAKGRYLTFIDDDDAVAKDYVDSILEAIESDPQVITFDVMKYENGEAYKLMKYYLNNGPCRLAPDRTHYKLLPNHLCVWRKDVIKAQFPHKNLSEDHEWAAEMELYYDEIHHIDKVLYNYQFSKEDSQTRR